MPMISTGDACEGTRGEPGAAAEIDDATEGRRPVRRGARVEHRRQQQRRAAIAEIVDQCRLELRRILIEQGLHIGRPHAGEIGSAEPHQAQAGAVAIARIGRLRRAKRQDGALAIAEQFADFAEREPCCRKTRRQVRRLDKQVFGGDEIAAQLQVAGKVEAPVGEHIAR